VSKAQQHIVATTRFLYGCGGQTINEGWGYRATVVDLEKVVIDGSGTPWDYKLLIVPAKDGPPPDCDYSTIDEYIFEA
jgi:hypothetical protein